MKKTTRKTILSLAAIAMLVSTVGCANGPIRSFLQNKFQSHGCQAPPVDPSYGFDMGEAPVSDCASGNCGAVGQPVYSQGSGFQQGYSQNLPQGNTTSYMNDSYSHGDPYINGSIQGGATINPPVFDRYSNPGYGSTIVPPGSTGSLPIPSGG